MFTWEIRALVSRDFTVALIKYVFADFGNLYKLTGINLFLFGILNIIQTKE